MTVHWTITDEGGAEIRWGWEELVVTAVAAGGGEWDVEYGRDETERLFSTAESYGDAIADAETCMRLLSMEYAGIPTG